MKGMTAAGPVLVGVIETPYGTHYIGDYVWYAAGASMELGRTGVITGSRPCEQLGRSLVIVFQLDPGSSPEGQPTDSDIIIPGEVIAEFVGTFLGELKRTPRYGTDQRFAAQVDDLLDGGWAAPDRLLPVDAVLIAIFVRVVADSFKDDLACIGVAYEVLFGEPYLVTDRT